MEKGFNPDFIQKTKEETLFTDIPSKKFFTEWCDKMDKSIVPQFISREAWEQKGREGILEKDEKGEQILFLPKDLQLWEVIDVIRVIDHDTLTRKPELREQRAEQVTELGQTFEKAGLYLTQYLPEIKEGNNIAETIAQEFYNYGRSIQEKVQNIDDLPQDNQLAEKDKQRLDEWFLGREVYRNRIARLGENPTPEQIEKMRIKTIQNYFKALNKKGYQAEGEEPWEIKKGPAQHIQDKTREGIVKKIKAPEKALRSSIFGRGAEKLITEMKTIGWQEAIQKLLKEEVDLDLATEQVKLYHSLEIPRLKQELEQIREIEDIPAIALKEREIAEKIQRAVCGFEYKISVNNPSEMIESQFINCVGSAILGGKLLDEVGIKYLHMDLLKHSATILITSDEKIYWQDFTPSTGYTKNHEITEERLLKNEPKIKIADIINFAKNPKDNILSITAESPYKIYGKKIRITLLNPELGLQSHILNNMGNILFNLNKYEEAIKAYQGAIDINSKNAHPYNGLGNALISLGRFEEAIKAYQGAIDINSKNAHPYSGLGDALKSLGRFEEAIKAYKVFVKLWQDDQYWTIKAERIIKELEQKLKK